MPFFPVGLPPGPINNADGSLAEPWISFFNALLSRTGGPQGISSDTSTLSAQIAAESAARASADTSLTASISSEASARATGDAAEAAQRINLQQTVNVLAASVAQAGRDISTFTLPPGQLMGTSTNDNAAAGKVGEFISSSIPVGSGLSIATGTPADITSISLTAGDWDVWGAVLFAPAAGTTSTVLSGWVSTVSATVPTLPNGGAFGSLAAAFPAGQRQVIQAGMMRQSLGGTTTVYLSTVATFAVSTMVAYGFIGARRAR